MSNKIKWGVIGCGGIAARRTIPEFKKMVSNAELVSVMDINPQRAKEVAAQFGVPHSCATEAELLAQDVQAVYIATPPNVHCRQTVQAAQAGKHVLCEKPIAISVDEVDQMEAACAKAGVKFMLAWCMRQNVYHKKARELVQAGALGKMVMGRAQLTCWYPPIPGAWRQDVSISHGGALLDMGTHCLDLLEWIMDTSIVEVTGFQRPARPQVRHPDRGHLDHPRPLPQRRPRHHRQLLQHPGCRRPERPRTLRHQGLHHRPGHDRPGPDRPHVQHPPGPGDRL